MNNSAVVQPERAPDPTIEDSPQYVTAPPREIVVGDKVKLRSFGSVGIVDQIKDGIAEVRVKSLRFRERLDNLELVSSSQLQKHNRVNWRSSKVSEY